VFPFIFSFPPPLSFPSLQVSPVIKNASESKCSLQFAERVKKVELGSAKKVSESAEMASLRKRIRELEGAS
jgi:kinesin family protein C2/C3